MRVKYKQASPPYWEVVAGHKWWSVAYNRETYRYLITNHAGRILDETGPTGRKVLAAVHDHERGTER